MYFIIVWMKRGKNLDQREITLNNDKLGFIVLQSLRNTCSTSFRALQVSLIQVSLLFFLPSGIVLPCNRKPSPLSRSLAFQFFFSSFDRERERERKKNNKQQRRIKFSTCNFKIYGYLLWRLLYCTCFHVLRSHFLFGQCTGSVDQATVLQISRWSHLKFCRVFNKPKRFPSITTLSNPFFLFSFNNNP